MHLLFVHIAAVLREFAVAGVPSQVMGIGPAIPAVLKQVRVQSTAYNTSTMCFGMKGGCFVPGP